MSRASGFSVMDVSTSWLDDDKFARLAREYPALHLWGVAAYAATKAASWRHGKRMKCYDSLPAWLRYEPDGLAALIAVKLLDRTTRIPVGPWRSWYEMAAKRRADARERRDRYDAKQRESRTDSDVAPTTPPTSGRRHTVRSSRSGRSVRKNGSTRPLATVAGEADVRPALSLVEPLEETA